MGRESKGIWVIDMKREREKERRSSRSKEENSENGEKEKKVYECFPSWLACHHHRQRILTAKPYACSCLSTRDRQRSSGLFYFTSLPLCSCILSHRKAAFHDNPKKCRRRPAPQSLKVFCVKKCLFGSSRLTTSLPSPCLPKNGFAHIYFSGGKGEEMEVSGALVARNRKRRG